MQEDKLIKLCPKFSICSAPKCPLDNEIDRKISYQEDPKCTLSRKRRLEIGMNSCLPYKGLTKQEYYLARLNGHL